MLLQKEYLVHFIKNLYKGSSRRPSVGTGDLRSPADVNQLPCSENTAASEAFIQTDARFINLCSVWCRLACVCKVENLNEKTQQQQQQPWPLAGSLWLK